MALQKAEGALAVRKNRKQEKQVKKAEKPVKSTAKQVEKEQPPQEKEKKTTPAEKPANTPEEHKNTTQRLLDAKNAAESRFVNQLCNKNVRKFIIIDIVFFIRLRYDRRSIGFWYNVCLNPIHLYGRSRFSVIAEKRKQLL